MTGNHVLHARETRADAHTAKVLTMDKARRVASNIAKLPDLVKPGQALAYCYGCEMRADADAANCADDG